MLILTKKINEVIMVSDNVQIKILDIIEGQVKLGIKASRGILVYRKEIYLRIRRYGTNSAKSNNKK